MDHGRDSRESYGGSTSISKRSKSTRSRKRKSLENGHRGGQQDFFNPSTDFKEAPNPHPTVSQAPSKFAHPGSNFSSLAVAATTGQHPASYKEPDQTHLHRGDSTKSAKQTLRNLHNLYSQAVSAKQSKLPSQSQSKYQHQNLNQGQGHGQGQHQSKYQLPNNSSNVSASTNFRREESGNLVQIGSRPSTPSRTGDGIGGAGNVSTSKLSHYPQANHSADAQEKQNHLIPVEASPRSSLSLKQSQYQNSNDQQRQPQKQAEQTSGNMSPALSAGGSWSGSQKSLALRHSPMSMLGKSAIDVDRDKDKENQIRKLLKAIKKGHVFEIRDNGASGCYPARKALLARGWIEKARPTKDLSKTQTQTEMRFSKTTSGSTTSQRSSITVKGQDQGGEEEQASTISIRSGSTKSSKSVKSREIPSSFSRLDVAKSWINKQPANLIWINSINKVKWERMANWQMCNMHPQDTYLLKKNIVDPIRTMHWLGTEPGICISAFPRTYRLYDDEEKNAFLQDFKLTAVMALLKWFIHAFEQPGEQQQNVSDSTAENGKMAANLSDLINFSMIQARNYIRTRYHGDIDDRVQPPIAGTHLTWDSFLVQSYQAIHSSPSWSKFKISKVMKKYKEVKKILEELRVLWPQFYIDGMRNVWVFKPGSGMKGHGIKILDKLSDITEKFFKVPLRSGSWIAQKYVERPLLIHKTKVDIRQWFLVSSWLPLTAWIYKQQYIRFSGTHFTLDDLGEQIHLTNNTLQMQYPINPERNSSLPASNMWSSTTFRNYLEDIGQPLVWSTVTYPEMKAAILALLLSARDFIDHRPGSFTLQGVDFMISDDFRPWLLEVNANPLLSSFNSVTSQLTPRCIQDTLKVILDWNDGSNPDADTGDFELLYRANNKFIPPSLKSSKKDPSPSVNVEEIVIEGQSLPTKEVFDEPRKSKRKIHA